MIHAAAFPWAPKPEVRMEWLSPELKANIQPYEYMQERYQEALDEVSRLPGEDALSAWMREILYLSLTRWMPTLLGRKDRMSMAFGLEVRGPYFNAVRKWALTILDDPNSPLRDLVDVGKLRSLAQSEDMTNNVSWFGQLMSRSQLFAYLIQADTWLWKYKVKFV